MSEREASVKLTLDDGQYLVSMRKVGDEGEKAGHKGHKAMGLFGEGVHGATHAVHGLHKSLETASELIVGLAAGFSLEEAIKTTIELDAKFKHLAFSISGANGEMVSAHELQEMVEQSAAKAGRRTVEMADSFEKLVKATGNSKFAEESLTAIGTTATATGESVESLTHLAEQLHEKFEVGGEEMASVLAQVVSAAQHGGPQIDQFAEVAGNMGAELQLAGLDGRRGLDFMIGSLMQLKSHVGTLPKAVKGVKALLGELGDKTKMTDIGKHAGIDPAQLLKEKDILGRLRMIMGKGSKGIDALKNSMHNSDEKQALQHIFLDPFQAALEKAVESGKKGKGALDAALDGLDADIGKMGESALSAADVQREANDRMKDPQMQLQHAMEELEKSFSQPEIIEALNQMAQSLPKVAGVFASFVKFAAGSPLLAGAAVVGVKAGMGFGGAIGSRLLKKGMRSSNKAFSSAVKRSSTINAGKALSERIENAHVRGIKVGSPLLALGVAAAVYEAWTQGKALIDSAFGENNKATNDLAGAGAVAASNGGSIEKQKDDAEKLKAAIAAAKENLEGVSGFTMDLMGGLATVFGADAPNLRGQNEGQIQEMQAELEEKERHIAELEHGKGGAHGKGAHGKAETADHKATGKAVADALKSGKPMPVYIQNLGSFGAPGGGGPQGSRGPTKPAAPHHGGGY